MNRVADLLSRGGPAMWMIGALSVLTLALIMFKSWRLLQMGAWAGRRASQAVRLWQTGDRDAAMAEAASARGLRGQLVQAVMAVLMRDLAGDIAREEVTRQAKALLADAGSGLRALALIAAIAPLLGLLGTVFGMIEAFQTLQQAGGRADPAALAGGIWEALLTTAAGMSVAIPASMALVWFQSVVDRAGADMEDLATQLFVTWESR